MMKKIWKTAAAWFFFGWVAAAVPVMAAPPGIKVLDAAAARASFVPMKAMTSHTRAISLVDPNFKADGPARFTGIALEKLMDISGLVLDSQGVTAVGVDQYVGFFPAGRVVQDGGLLVWQMDGRKIPVFKGGPLKIVFPLEAGIHGACYTWYVDILIAGTFDNPGLAIQQQTGRKVFARNTLLSRSMALAPYLASFPQGCRNALLDKRPEKDLRAVPLTDLIQEPPVSGITLKTLAGKDIRLRADIFNYPAFLVVGTWNAALHPAFGGPFSLVFPVEQHPDLAELVPESGAVFFLEEIVIE